MAPNFAASSSDPRAAYALGMLFKMLRAAPAKPQASPATAAAGVQLERLRLVLESPLVAARDKQGLVEAIEGAENVQDVWALLDRVPAAAADASASAATATVDADIPTELGCAICCSELMLQPASLACGHSFCKYCLELWLATRSNCPTCRQAVANDAPPPSINLALQQVVESFYPAQLRELEKQSQAERFEQLRIAIRAAVTAGGSSDLREVLARLSPCGSDSSNHSANARRQDRSLAVSLILESDVELQEQVLAAEIHERLRKEKLLRESSRRRHTAAYNATGLTTQVDPAILNINNSTTTVRRGSGGSGGSSKSQSSSNLLTSFLGRKS